MTERLESGRDSGAVPAIAAYKAILQEVLERRPSGTRQRLAQALEKARSFVTQITNPAYAAPVPAQHLSVIFEVCHFSPAERQRFITAYTAAHPRRLIGLAAGPRHRTLHIVVPDFGDDARNRELQKMVQDFATNLAKFAGPPVALHPDASPHLLTAHPDPATTPENKPGAAPADGAGQRRAVAVRSRGD